MRAYSEAKVASVLYARELAERLQGTGVSVFSSTRGGPARTSAPAPVSRERADDRGAATQPIRVGQQRAVGPDHAALPDLRRRTRHSGAYFSQSSILYRDKECRDGGWPMESPNPHATDMDTARKLVDMSYDLVGLAKPTA